MATNGKIPEVDLTALCLRVVGVDVEPEFCSLDHIGDMPDFAADPFVILARREEKQGIPLVFDRECDRVIRAARHSHKLETL